MGLFSNLGTQGLEEKQDRLGGFQLQETDIYLAKVKMAYAGKAKSGAQNITLILSLPGEKEYTETVYITNKDGENFFLNPQDRSKKVGLPGFNLIDDLCLVTTEKPLSEQDAEEKVVKIYDYEQKKEIPTNVPVLTDLIGKQAYFAIVKQVENKNVRNESTGEYEPTADTRESNTIEKVFHHPSMLSVAEAKNGVTEPAFYGAWQTKNKGVTRDRRKIKEGGSTSQGDAKTGKPGGAPTGGSGEPRKAASLFNK